MHAIATIPGTGDCEKMFAGCPVDSIGMHLPDTNGWCNLESLKWTAQHAGFSHSVIADNKRQMERWEQLAVAECVIHRRVWLNRLLAW